MVCGGFLDVFGVGVGEYWAGFVAVLECLIRSY